MKKRKFAAIVNNVGTFAEETFENFDFAEWDRVLEVNLTTPLIVSIELQSCLQHGASIVNISSTDGFTGSFGSMAYSASKAALSNLTKSFANNFAVMGVRVNAICFGWINTGMLTDASFKATHLAVRTKWLFRGDRKHCKFSHFRRCKLHNWGKHCCRWRLYERRLHHARRSWSRNAKI